MSGTIKNTDYVENTQLCDEMFEIYYVGGDDEDRVISSALVDIPDFDADGGQRALNLLDTSGDGFEFFEVTPQRVLTRRGEDEGREMDAYVTDNRELAIGIYLGHLEIHGVVESEAWKHIEDNLPAHWLDDYVAYVDDLSTKERGRVMMKQVERKMKAFREYGSMSPFWSKTMADGEWREKGPSDDAIGLIESTVDSVDLDPRSCHYTAQGVFSEIWERDDVEYCEGFAFSKWLGRTLRHAWLEVGGKVVEVTWPWHRFDGDEGMYYGVSIQTDVVKERMESRGRGTIALLDDAERMMLSQQNRREAPG